MSELKVKRHIDEDTGIVFSFYGKSEADKVIADLEESHKMEVEQLLIEIAELKKERNWLAKDRAQAYNDLEKRAQLNIKQEESIRHNKYKRCHDNAWRCRKLSNVYALIAYTHRGWKIARYYDEKAELYRKWNTRWLKIAEQFKDKGAK